MKLNLFHTKEVKEPHIDIHYRQMTPVIEKVIRLVREDKPVLYGISQREEKVLLDINAIYYIDSVEKRVFAYTKEAVYRLSGNLQQLEAELADYGYVRINKSSLINIYKVDRIKPEANMRVMAIFDNGEKLYINRSYKKNFQNYLESRREVLKIENSQRD